ncbi:MAG: decarboxylating NADP(+)-dependent phosphogluconate dehydrogenase, partial [Caldilineaceae bacterium]
SSRREKELAEHGILFVGSGVSGGEEGARFGPSIMPGGAAAAWPHIQPIFQAIAAKAEDGAPCADWLGPGGSGHFVKMVHNGIEYGDMQLIAEAYDLLSNGLGMTPDEMSEVFARWNQGKLNSYLIEITAEILAFKDDDGAPIIDKILDTAGQKGTGKWTVSAALDMGTPLTLIGEAVFSRFLSARKEQRVEAAGVLGDAVGRYQGDRAAFVDDIGAALYASKIASYAQGYMLFRAAADEFGWPLAYATIARIWRAGCIIRAAFLNDITAAYEADPDLPNLLLAPYFRDAVLTSQDAWRRVVATGAQLGITTPAMSSALAFFDGFRRGRLPANMIQAQRDYFGAHTYERVDRPRGEFFHTNWTGQGGTVTASEYNA